MGTGSFESAAEVVACEKNVSVEIDRQTIEGQVGSVVDLVCRNRAREKGRKQPEINKASHGEAVTLQGALMSRAAGSAFSAVTMASCRRAMQRRSRILISNFSFVPIAPASTGGCAQDAPPGV
jgi:hypothetical protein